MQIYPGRNMAKSNKLTNKCCKDHNGQLQFWIFGCCAIFCFSRKLYSYTVIHKVVIYSFKNAIE